MKSHFKNISLNQNKFVILFVLYVDDMIMNKYMIVNLQVKKTLCDIIFIFKNDSNCLSTL